MSVLRQMKIQDGIDPTLLAEVDSNKKLQTLDSSAVSAINSAAASTGIYACDSPSIDAFGRWRISNPLTVFDSKNIFDDPDLASSVENQPLFYDNAETSGSGTTTTYTANESSQSISVAGTTAGTRIRQTKMRFNYQPGKSQLIFMTFNFNGNATGIVMREGYFDANNGIFLASKSTGYYICLRTYTGGSPSDNEILQSNWNIDTFDGNGPSGVTLNFENAQILVIDFEWLGVGRIRVGFVVDGKIYYAHQFLNSNNVTKVYMQTPNLPLRSEIVNDGTGAAHSLVQICSTVISEGGFDENGAIRSADTGGTQVSCTTENISYAIIGMQLKSGYLAATVKLLSIALQIQSASKMVRWRVMLNPTVGGTFTYSGESQSAVQIARGASTNTVTNGYCILSGFAESGGVSSGASGSSEKGIQTTIRLGSTISGTADTIVLCCTPVGGTSGVDVEGSLTWREQ